jgi:hypothetical protein
MSNKFGKFLPNYYEMFLLNYFGILFPYYFLIFGLWKCNQNMATPKEEPLAEILLIFDKTKIILTYRKKHFMSTFWEKKNFTYGQIFK